METVTLKEKKMKKKQRHQVKSRWYYIFWGTATVTVFAGQMYVGNGFRRMADSLDNVLESPILLDIGPPMRHQWNEPKHPMIIP